MMKKLDWNIYNAEGGYLGQAKAFCAITALCDLMSLQGRLIAERALHSEQIDESSEKVLLGSEEFLVVAGGLPRQVDKNGASGAAAG